jgi:putative RNA 2'-phosphotransferase
MKNAERESANFSASFCVTNPRHQFGFDENGWAAVADLLAKSAQCGNIFTFEELTKSWRRMTKSVFRSTRRKRRFAPIKDIRFGSNRIRRKIPPPILYHGTAERNLGSILKTGLEKRARHHVHLSRDEETAQAVGRRHGKPAILRIDAARMAAQGHKFYISANEVWLVERVAPEFLEVL